MREYSLIVLIGITVTFFMCSAAREVAMAIGATARVRDRDVHAVPVPYLGGIAMMIGAWAAYLVAIRLPFLGASPQVVLDDTLTILIAGTFICAFGLLDDLIEIDALAKLGAQLLACGYVVFHGVQFSWLPLPNNGQFVLDSSLAGVITVGFMVTCINAINFVDGLDGLAAGTVAIGAASYFVFAYWLASSSGKPLSITACIMCAIVLGCALGFLPHNVFPARMFMGDSGSMFLGILLSAGVISLFNQYPAGDFASRVGLASSYGITFIPVLLPFAILAVPQLDMILAVIRRTRQGTSPFQPDKQHLHHRLMEIGHSHPRAVLAMWVWAAAVSATGLLFVMSPVRWLATVPIPLALASATVIRRSGRSISRRIT